MWISRKKYNELKEQNNALRKINISLMQDYNSLAKENYEMAKQLKELESKKTTTRKSKNKKEDK